MGLKWAIAHDACRSGDRHPLGAVPIGTPVSVTLRVDGAVRWRVRHAEALVCEYGEWRAVRMDACDGGFTASLQLDSRVHVAFYVFRLTVDDQVVAYYVPRTDGRSTAGELALPDVDGEWGDAGWLRYEHAWALRPSGDYGLPEMPPGFQVTVYDGAFSTPEWLAGAIMYQIFPDRFARGGDGVRREGLAYHERMRRPVFLHESWDEPVEWEGDPHYDPVDFYGGTLDGIREKLGYLESLGVEVVYLNPVFEARSNHRYDTADYERIDPLLGDEDALRRLAEEASRHGISLVLDAVLSHTGDDSRYFNAMGNYDGPGAVQGSLSPFFNWYEFTHQEGQGAGYKSWWGFPSLPEVDERHPSWQRYMFGDDGVLPHWLLAGARGYRLDVADEIPDDVLAALRRCVKAVNPEAAIIGEVWEDPTTKTSYGTPRDYALGPSLDSVMNYPLRAALIGFALHTIDAHQLATFLKLQQANYPAPLYRCLMNLLSSHDMERVRSVLALGGPLKQLSREGQRAVVAGISARSDKRAARLQRLIAGLLYALPGTPCLYYGDERGLQGGGDPFCRATFPWGDAAGCATGGESAEQAEHAGRRPDCGVDLTSFYQRLGSLRKGSEALRKGDCLVFAPHEDVVCVVRTLPHGQSALAVANRSEKRLSVAIDTKGLAAAPLSLDSLPVEDGLVRIDAKACETAFFF